MDTLNINTDLTVSAEAVAERKRRLEWEAAALAEARADLDAGFYVDSADIGAWIDSVGTGNELPLPQTRRR